MKDRQTATPGRVLITPENGTAPFNAIITRDDNAEVEGTPLNKATLLSDDVAASFGLSGDAATPDGVFEATNKRFLSMGNLHVWKYEDSNGNIEFFVNKDRNGYPEGPTDYIEPTFKKISSDKTGIITWAYSQGTSIWCNIADEIVVSGSGELSLKNPANETVSAYADTAEVLLGKFFEVDGYETDFLKTELESNKIYFIPSDATFTKGIWNVYVSTIYEVEGIPESKSGTYTYMGQLGNRPCVQTGSWTGTGTYGESNANMLTFDFVPQFVMVYSTMSSSGGISSPDFNGAVNRKNVMVFDELTTSYTSRAGFRPDSNNYSFAKKSADGKTWYWYNNASAYAQYNDPNLRYLYLTVGKE